MKLSELPRLMSPTYWLLAGLAAFVIVFWAWWVITEPGRANRRADEAAASSEFANARTAATTDAIGAVIDRGRQESTIDANVKEAERELRQAPEDQRNAVALRRLCLSDSTRDDPACRALREPRP